MAVTKIMLGIFAGMLAVSSLAAQNRGAGCCGGAGPSAIAGTPIVELRGNIAEVRIAPGAGTPFVTIKHGDEVTKLYLGSMRYLMVQGFNPKVDEEIVAKAYKVNDGFIAATVTLPAQNKTVRLRDESGRPVWRGGPRGAGVR
jgi:hypothetical protein